MSIHSTGLGDFGRRVVSPRVACTLLSCSRNTIYRLIASGELESFVLGLRIPLIADRHSV
jgi:excisionase family DNA binding protein